MQFHFAVAIAAVHASTGTRFKWYLGVFSTIGAYCPKHLVAGIVPVAAGSVPVRLPCLAARGAVFGLVCKTPGMEKLLFLSADSESSPAIGTTNRLVLEIH